MRYLVKTSLLCLLLALLIVSVQSWRLYKNEQHDARFDPDIHSLFSVRYGTGNQPVLLLHGLAGSGRYWQRNQSLISERFDVLIPDLLGFGRSIKPDAIYNLDDHVIAVEKLLLKTRFINGERPALVVAHSLGAIVALGLMAKKPDWFKGAVLIGLPSYNTKEEGISFLTRQSKMAHSIIDNSAWAQISCHFHAMFRLKWLARVLDIPEDVYIDGTRHTWSSVSKTLMNTILATNVNKLVQRVANTPIIYVHGDEDKVAPLENIQRLAAGYNNHRMVIVSDTGHHLFLYESNTIWQILSGME